MLRILPFFEVRSINIRRHLSKRQPACIFFPFRFVPPYGGGMENNMKKKLLSLLMCAAVLFGTFPAAVFAEETTEQNGAKLGVKRGDIVTYAGSDTPIEWRVIDPDKTNIPNETKTENIDGMLLLSENAGIKAVQDTKSLTGLKDECEKFYNDNFTDNNAVMKVTKTDEPYVLNGDTYNGKLDNDTVFALSRSEAENLTEAERTFTAFWWLRSTKIGTYYRDLITGMIDETLFTSVQPNGKIRTDKITEAENLFLRPAVNLDKTKLANLDGKPLLLPAGEFTEADNNNLALTGTASKWKLSVKNDVKIVSAHSYNTDTLLKIDVTTDLTNFSDNDYISVIIVKPDGSIPYYGRFTMNRTGFANIRTGMPSGIDKDNDSLYVFYENYNGALSGSVSELKKVCFEHEYIYEDLSEEDMHSYECKNCGMWGKTIHTMSYQGDELTHTGTCELCGHKVTGNHNYEKQYLSTYAQEFKCSDCGKHTFTAIMGGFEKSKAVIRNDEIDNKTLAFESCTTQGDPRNFLYVSDDEESSFTFYDCTDNTAAVTFKTKHAVKATGIRTAVPNFGTPEKTPSTLTLYGKNSESEDYTKIGAVVFRPILSNYNSIYYSFLFADTASIAPYSDYKLELYNENSNTIMSGSFGLFSEPGSALNLDLMGALAQGAPSAVYPGVDSSFTLIAIDGHPKKSEISVTADDEALDDSCWTYDEDSGIFTLLGEHITSSVTEYNVTVECENKSIDVVIKLSENQNLVCDTPKKEVIFGKDYTCYFYDTISPDQNLYVPQEGDYTVKSGDNDITEYCKIDEESMLTVPKEHITASSLTITANEAGTADPKSSEIMIERKGSWGTTPRYYRTVEDALRDISYPGSKNITVISKNDTVSIPYNAEITLNGTEINLNLNGKTLDYVPKSSIVLESGTKLNVKNGTIKCPVGIFKVQEGSSLQLSDVAVIPSNSNGGGIEVYGGTIEKISNSDSVYINTLYIGNNSKVTLEKGTINNLILEKNYNLQIYSGTVNQILNYGPSLDYKSFLAPGSEFYDIKDLDAFNNGKPTGFSVKCGHINVDDDTGICSVCGKQLQIKATCGETVNYYDNITEAIAFSNENANASITLYTDTEAAATSSAPLIFSGKNTTLDLNGKTFTVTGLENIEVSGTLTITGNGNVNSNIVTNADSALITIENGEFNRKVSGRLLLNGGKFANITAYTNTLNDVLGNGMAYKNNSDDTFITYPGKNIINVTVTNAPFKITKQPESKLISDISAGGTISVEIDITPGYENDITYQWYEKVYDHNNNNWTEQELDSHINVYQLPTNVSSGEQKMYKCVISCKGHSVSTDYAICTFGSDVPYLKYDSDILSASSYGKDAVLAAAAYRDGKLLAIETTELKANSGPFIWEYPFSGIEDGADCLKAFLWDGLDTMKPLAEPIEISRNNISIWYNDTGFGAYSEEIPCTVIVASYNGNKLIDSKSVRLDESNEFCIKTDYKSLGLNTESSGEIKTFVWKDFQSMKPLGFDMINEEDYD